MLFPTTRRQHHGHAQRSSAERRRVLMYLLSFGLTLSLIACGTHERPDAGRSDGVPADEVPMADTPLDQTPVAETPVDQSPVDESPVDEAPVTTLSLRGDPAFDGETLSEEKRGWYDALMVRIASPANDFDPMRFARRDDVYHYGRTLHTYVQSVLLAFRVTGDLALLDHVDAIAEVMREQLRDGWRGTLDGTDGTRDGYLNWVFRYGNSTTYQGKDTHQVNEMRTHSMIAMIAYALHVNRDLVSPGGRDYAAHADFWVDYLVNHFEAKWHYYMGLLTGDGAYTAESERMAGVLRDELREVSTASGTAYVWARSVLAEGGGDSSLHPTTYARYMYADIVELHLEGFEWWADAVHLERFARTVTAFVIDTADPLRNDFSHDIGGGVDRAGLQSDASWNRMSVARYAISGYAHIAAWDASGALPELSAAIQDQRVDRDRETMPLMAGAILDTAIDAGVATSARRR